MNYFHYKKLNYIDSGPTCLHIVAGYYNEITALDASGFILVLLVKMF